MKEKNKPKEKMMGLGMQNANDTFDAVYGDESRTLRISEEDAAIMERMQNAGSGWGDLEELPDHASDFSALTPVELEGKNTDLEYYYDLAIKTGDAESCRTALELAGSLSRVNYGNASEKYQSLELKYRQIRDKAYREAMILQDAAKKPADYQKAYEAFCAPELVGYRDCDSRAQICLGRTVKVGPTPMEDLKETMTAPKKVRIHLNFAKEEENKRLIWLLVFGSILVGVFLLMAVWGFTTGFIGYSQWIKGVLEEIP